MSEPHYKALVKLLEDRSALIPEGVGVHLGSFPGTPGPTDYPYVIVGGNAGLETAAAPVARPDTLDLRFRLTYAGLSFESVMFLIRECRQVLIGARLHVDGWTCAPLQHETLLDIRTDFDVSITGVGSPMFAIDELALFAGR